MEADTLLGVHSKLQARGKYTNSNLNNMIRTAVTKTEIFEKNEIFEKLVGVGEYFSRYIFHYRGHEDHPCKISGKNIKYRGK